MTAKNRKRVTRSKRGDRKHITIETPCSVSELEHLLSLVSHEGHWHDAQISAAQGKLVIGYEDDAEEAVAIMKANPAYAEFAWYL